MRIAQLNLYPIKSLRGISLPSATLCPQGLQYDRRYVLLKLGDNGTYSNMWVGGQPEMALFHCQFSTPTSFTVSYRAPTNPVTPQDFSQKTTLEIPFTPSIEGLQQTHISLHRSDDWPAYIMADEYNGWFSECFGYQVVLVFAGDGLGLPKFDEKAEKWKSKLQPILSKSVHAVFFSQDGALLVTSEASVEALNSRLPPGEKVIHEKFRPNIVIDGEELDAWEEDFWAELEIVRSQLKLVLTSHCARCIAINVDLEKGRKGEGESGILLKKMMSDRRVDPGHKWHPIFGRLGFPISAGEIRVGDEVTVTKRNTEYNTWDGLVPRLSTFED